MADAPAVSLSSRRASLLISPPSREGKIRMNWIQDPFYLRRPPRLVSVPRFNSLINDSPPGSVSGRRLGHDALRPAVPPTHARVTFRSPQLPTIHFARRTIHIRTKTSRPAMRPPTKPIAP